MRLPSWLHSSPDEGGSSGEPLRLLRVTVGVLLLFATVVAVALALSGVAPRALQLVGVFWAVYGFIAGVTSGVLEPVIEGVVHALTNVGLMRSGGGYSVIESRVARGDYAGAAELYRERAQRPGDRVEATVRRAALLAGPLGHPETALVELESLRRGPLRPADDVRVGVALVGIYERRLQDPGRAMGELRRLLDRHPDHVSSRRLRRALADLKDEHLPAQPV